MIRKVFTLKYCSGLIFPSYCYQLFALNENVTQVGQQRLAFCHEYREMDVVLCSVSKVGRTKALSLMYFILLTLVFSADLTKHL